MSKIISRINREQILIIKIHFIDFFLMLHYVNKVYGLVKQANKEWDILMIKNGWDNSRIIRFLFLRTQEGR